jgi:hypothetical protein
LSGLMKKMKEGAIAPNRDGAVRNEAVDPRW